MNKPRIVYFEKEDVLHLIITDEAERNSLEMAPNITAELNGQNELIGIEILNASSFLRDMTLESVQARVAQVLAVAA
jgi:uncharacterized protein YuzE